MISEVLTSISKLFHDFTCIIHKVNVLASPHHLFVHISISADPKIMKFGMVLYLDCIKRIKQEKIFFLLETDFLEDK